MLIYIDRCLTFCFLRGKAWLFIQTLPSVEGEGVKLCVPRISWYPIGFHVGVISGVALPICESRTTSSNTTNFLPALVMKGRRRPHAFGSPSICSCH
jgi:hypothetical protein